MAVVARRLGASLVVDLFFYNYYIRKGKAFTASGGESPQTVRRSDDQ